MTPLRRKQLRRSARSDKPQNLDRNFFRSSLFLWMILISLLFHLASLIPISYFSEGRRVAQTEKSSKVKIRIVETKKAKTAKDKELEPSKRILEAKQRETTKPDDAKFLGEVDHKAREETKARLDPNRKKAADPGTRGTANPQSAVAASPSKPAETLAPSGVERLIEGRGQIKVQKHRENDDRIAALMPSAQELAGQENAGFQDYIAEEIKIGDRVDLSTTHYRYVGYFSSMRKSIELVWNYPYAAASRGLEGVVQLEFMIEESGEARGVKVLKSSGYKVLDDAIVDAIRLASPFAPLPSSFQKKPLPVTGSFHYILSSMAGAH